jgi:hypothetical protein
MMTALGTIDDPLTISDAMGYEWIKPGHTVYLRGGVYNAQSSLTCTLQGTAEEPIIVRNYPGEIAQIDAALLLSCPHTRWMSDDYGLEVIGTCTTRFSEIPGSALPSDIAGHDSVSIAAEGVELINVRMINYTSSGVTWFGSYPGLIYGCHIIHVGWIGPDRWHGPGIYTHNDAGVEKRIENTVILDSFRYGLQMYSASNNRLLNYNVIDVTVIGPEIICSGAPAAEYPAMDGIVFNRLWQRDGWPRLGVYMGNRGGECQLLNSVIHRLGYAYEAERIDSLIVENGRFLSTNQALTDCEPTVINCTFGNLSGVDVNLVPNTYAPRFATLTVFDWDQSGTVEIDVSAFAEAGTVRVHNIILMRTEYRDVEVVRGVLALDMTGWTTPPPLGMDKVMTNAYPGDFGVWILEKLEA